MPVIDIRGCRIGEGRPKTIIPIVEKTAEDIAAKGAEFASLPADFVEWRVDWFEAHTDSAALEDCLRGLHAALRGKPLLVTIRTAKEGGESDLPIDLYADLCRTIAKTGCADLIDVELLPMGDMLPALLAELHAMGAKVICSSHDFEKTPEKQELIARMTAMQRAGADIAKLAVMPRSRADVLTLLEATAEMAEHHPETPVVTMSMSAFGAISRLCGEAMGSAMTFASAGKASAPGQIDLDTMNRVLAGLSLS